MGRETKNELSIFPELPEAQNNKPAEVMLYALVYDSESKTGVSRVERP